MNLFNKSEAGLVAGSAADLEKMLGNDHLLKARHIMVHGSTPKLWFDGICIGSPHRVHVLLCGTSPACIALARQAALLCHFPNFDESTGRGRTLITFVTGTPDDPATPADALSRVRDSALLGNLPDYCHILFTRHAADGWTHESVSGRGSFLDVEIEIADISGSSLAEYAEQCCAADEYVTCFGVQPESALFSNVACRQYLRVDTEPMTSERRRQYLSEIDFTRAMLVNKVYAIGTGLREVSNFSNLDAAEYNMSLQRFCDEITRRTVAASWREITGPSATEIKLSNLYCADCIDVKLASLGLSEADCAAAKGRVGLFGLSLRSGWRHKPRAREVLEKNLEPMARTEHARWNVEKLILGYHPYTRADHYADEQLVGKERADRRRKLKNEQKRHIDICSCRDLMHIDPASLKYDCFLTLAIDRILTLESRYTSRNHKES